MIKGFSSIVWDKNQNEIARVNRQDGTLYLKPQIWDSLPEAEKDFVLWHEKGHLILQTTDEFTANKYAVKNLLPSHTLSNPELKKRITVMQSILTKGNETSGFTATINPRTTLSVISGFEGSADPVSAVAGAIGQVMQSLPLLGVGSAARKSEIEAQAQANAELIAADAAAKKKAQSEYLIYGIIGGAILLVGIVLFFTLRKRR